MKRKREEKEEEISSLSDNFSSSLKINNELNLNVKPFKDEVITNNEEEKKVKKDQCVPGNPSGFECVLISFDHNTKFWKEHFNHDKFLFLGLFTTNNEANHLILPELNALDQLYVRDKKIGRGGELCLKGAYLWLDRVFSVVKRRY